MSTNKLEGGTQERHALICTGCDEADDLLVLLLEVLGWTATRSTIPDARDVAASRLIFYGAGSRSPCAHDDAGHFLVSVGVADAGPSDANTGRAHHLRLPLDVRQVEDVIIAAG